MRHKDAPAEQQPAQPAPAPVRRTTAKRLGALYQELRAELPPQIADDIIRKVGLRWAESDIALRIKTIDE
jgi:hypothetical protein